MQQFINWPQQILAEIGGCAPLGEGRGLPAYPDPSNRLATYTKTNVTVSQSDRTGLTGQRSDSIGELFYKGSPKNYP